ncbi:FHIPEP family type III secretion protein [Escherichia coli]
MISTAAGVIVARLSANQDVGEQMVNQLFSNPSVMLLSAAVLVYWPHCLECRSLVLLLFTAVAGAGLVDTRTRTKSACRTQTGKSGKE